MRGLSHFVVSLGLLGCAASPRANSGVAATSAPVASALPASPVAPKPAEQPGALVLQPLPALPQSERATRIEIEKPAFGDALDPRLAELYEVAVRAVDLAATDSVLVSLDGRRARRVVPERKLRLRDLYSEDQSLAPGAHFLLAVAVNADGRWLPAAGAAGPRALALVEFSVGERGAASPPARAPELFCLSPAGTHYLAPGARVLLQVLALRPERRSAPLRVRGVGLDVSGEVQLGQAYEVGGLPLGDVSFTAGEASGPHAECVITINPEPSPRQAP